MSNPIPQITLLPPVLSGDPEVVAMLQAFYSRSTQPIQERLLELGEDLPKIKESLSKYYINYGHDSIGDCGNTAIFIEGISMLAAKAIEDNPLFNGQETSTRFISFSKELLYSPTLATTKDTRIVTKIQDSWMSFYTDNLDTVIDSLSIVPYADYEDNISEETWKASIKARAFDIMRAFLPAGTLTRVSFYGSLRTLRDSMSMLQQHPLFELQLIATLTLEKLKEQYPSAFSKPKYTEQQQQFVSNYAVEHFYNFNCFYILADKYPDLRLFHKAQLKEYVELPKHAWEVIRWERILESNQPHIVSRVSLPLFIKEFLRNRPKGVKVPFQLGRYGQFNVDCMLDFGSFRDLQRHRNCKNPMPVLTTEYGMHPWYLATLSTVNSTVYIKALDLLASNKEMLDNLSITDIEQFLQLQYCIPMGYRVPVELSLDLDQMVYIAELRSSKSVHPTLRLIAQDMGNVLEEQGITVYFDKDPSGFVPKRGAQTIFKR